MIISRAVILGISCFTNDRPLIRRSHEILGKLKRQVFIKMLCRADTQATIIHKFSLSFHEIQQRYHIIWPLVDTKGVNQHALDDRIDELNSPLIESSAPFQDAILVLILWVILLEICFLQFPFEQWTIRIGKRKLLMSKPQLGLNVSDSL